MAGVEEHAVARSDLGEALPLDHRLHVGGGDDARTPRVRRDGQALEAAVRGRVEEHAAAHEAFLRHVFDAEVAQAYDAAARAALVDPAGRSRPL